MSISAAQALVRAFHEKFGVAAPNEPTDAAEVDQAAHVCRLGWLCSEIDEGYVAVDNDDQAELADAYVDIIVFALGGLVELGIDGGPLFDEVMTSNMAKVKLPGVAKISKPEGWKHPDIAALIEAQRKAR